VRLGDVDVVRPDLLDAERAQDALLDQLLVARIGAGGERLAEEGGAEVRVPQAPPAQPDTGEIADQLVDGRGRVGIGPVREPGAAQKGEGEARQAGGVRREVP
jgi:hypothetical protein